MKSKNTKLHILPKERKLEKLATTGVSLHCHTKFSKEIMDFIPFYAEKIPLVNYFWHWERDKYFAKYGKKIEFEKGYWTPPMTETDVYSAEKAQMESLGLNAIVSITDHDAIEANLRLCEHTPNEFAPISLEWTIPYKHGFFHIGVHNLPKNQADEIFQQLLAYTFSKNPTDENLQELFVVLNEMPEVLVIFNHPLWDIEMIGEEQHKFLLINFLAKFGKWIHALEINGFRAWSENKATIELAESLNIPLCTGGDRHGCQPNTVINLTRTKTFAEFVDEVRNDKHTEIAILPEYNQPLVSRQLQSFAEILGYHENFPEDRKHWVNRIFFEKDERGLISLAEHGWRTDERGWLQAIIWTFGLLGNPKLRPVYRMLQSKKDIATLPPNNDKSNVEQGLWLGKKEKLVADN